MPEEVEMNFRKIYKVSEHWIVNDKFYREISDLSNP